MVAVVGPTAAGKSDLGIALAQALGGEVVNVDLNRPMEEILRTLNHYPIKTRLSLSGPMVVARDIAHAKIKVTNDELLSERAVVADLLKG